MGSLKESILDCRTNAFDDDKFIEELTVLAQMNEEETYKATIQVLTDRDLSPRDAKTAWINILEHRENISKILDRNISLITAISDYFCSIKKPLKSCKIIEINNFEKMIKESNRDHLTGLFNKNYLQNALDQHLSLAKRHNTDLSILFLDIDDFKDINDTFGHHSGDIVLKNVANTINHEMRESDIKARFGGDEFVILMPNTYKLNALLLSERLRKTINQKKIALKDTSLQITVSGGVAGFSVDADKAENLLNLADRALYMAKGAGKNNISLFKEDKRRFLRIKFHRSIKVKQLGFSRTRTLSGKSKDIAVGGILFENKEPIPIGTTVQVSIPITKDADPLLLIGTIVRVETFGPEKYDIGMILSFKEMEKTAKDEISKFLIQNSDKNS
ncbi:MAG: diguanylate cyclase [Desulfobacteraceae bacterium]|nr:diguanylate cyclase [Desulfobacteraceae bacterium]